MILAYLKDCLSTTDVAVIYDVVTVIMFLRTYKTHHFTSITFASSVCKLNVEYDCVKNGIRQIRFWFLFRLRKMNDKRLRHLE